MEVEKITRALNEYLQVYRKLPDIIGLLELSGIKISEREFANYVELYRQGDHEYYLESCSNGYRFTRDIDCIKKSCNQRIGKALSMLKNAKRDLKYCGERNQLSMIDNFINEYESISNLVEVANNGN